MISRLCVTEARWPILAAQRCSSWASIPKPSPRPAARPLRCGGSTHTSSRLDPRGFAVSGAMESRQLLPAPHYTSSAGKCSLFLDAPAVRASAGRRSTSRGRLRVAIDARADGCRGAFFKRYFLAARPASALGRYKSFPHRIGPADLRLSVVDTSVNAVPSSQLSAVAFVDAGA